MKPTQKLRGLELPQKLAQVATVLAMLTTSALSHGALSTPTCRQPTSWGFSTYATVETDSALSIEDAVERALTEVDLTRAVLSLPVLRGEAGFRPYLDAIAHALENYETSPSAGMDRVVEFATTLSIARANLEQQVSSLPAWLEISRTVRPEAARYISVPPRFVSSSPVSIARETPPSAEEIAHSFEFDSLPLA